MKNLQKFSKKSMRKAIIKAIDKMSVEDAYTTCKGVYNLFEIFDEYYKDRYGSAKRLDDIIEYVYIIQCAYLKKEMGSK